MSILGSTNLAPQNYLGFRRTLMDQSSGQGHNFMVLWQQNMMRKLVNQSTIGTGASAEDLHLHGLAINARIDF